MSFKPLIRFRGTTMGKAFVLNAVLIAITTAITIETRRILDTHEFTKEFPDRPHKLGITIAVASITGLVGYIIARYTLGFGTGMLANKTPYPTFF